MLLPLGDDLERPWFPVATVVLIFVNVAVFAITFKAELTSESISHSMTENEFEQKIVDFQEFYQVWGSVPDKLVHGEVIGLLTHMFLHADLFHLIGNMLILWVFGQSLETALGSLAFTVMYVFWGVVACLTQAAVDFSSEVYLIGASGAIAGVIGGYIVMFGYSARIKMLFMLGVFPLRFSIPAIVFGVAWMFQQMYHASMDADGALSGVAWMAHIGGFGIGATTMLVFRNQTDRVLVRNDNRLTFCSREELLAAQVEEENRKAFQTDAAPVTAEIGSRSCDACGTKLSMENLMAERLSKCPNRECGQLTYLTDAEMAPARY